MPEPSDDVARQSTSPQPAADNARRDEPTGPSASSREAPGAAGSPEPGEASFPFERTFSFGKQLPRDVLSPEALERLRAGRSLSAEELEALRATVADPDAVVEGPVRRFSWTWGRKDGASDAVAARQPATYYEALTGKPDPQRDFFITARRILNIGTWVIALGFPIGIVALGIATGQSVETIVFMGIGALFVAMLFKSSFPRTPFG